MRISRRGLIPVAAAALIAASGVLHAVQTGAWSRGRHLAEAAARLHALPLEAGRWRGTELEFDRDQLKAAEAAGALSRSYSDPAGRSVSVMLLCGPHGPVAVHPPTVCFTAAGYSLATEQRRIVLPGQDGRPAAEFWSADFERTVDGRTVRTRTYWSWSDGSGWKAPDRPRFAFAGTPVLHKLYVTRSLGADDGSEPADEFLKAFLPAVDQTLFSSRS